MKYSKGIVKFLLCLLFLGVVGGCMFKTADERGDLQVTLCTVESGVSGNALASDIKELTVKITRTTDNYTQEKTETFTGNNQVVTFAGIYPGVWQVDVSAFDNVGTKIFAGTGEAQVDPGTATELQMTLKPTPGVLDVSLDASQIPGYGTTVTHGTLYVYLDPTSGTSKSYTLSPEGNYLKGTASIPEGTYEVKVAAPNVTDKVFLSPYYTVQIKAGKTTTLNIAPDGSINITGVIDSTPATPTGLTANYQNPPGTVELAWGTIGDSDFAGYRLYRSTNEGRMVRLTTGDLTVVQYTDNVTATDFYNHKIRYAVSSYDLGGNESFWSDQVEISE